MGQTMLEILTNSIQTLLYAILVGGIGFLIFKKYAFSNEDDSHVDGSSANENQKKELRQYQGSHANILGQNRANLRDVSRLPPAEHAQNFALEMLKKERKLLSGDTIKLDAVSAIYMVKNWSRFQFVVNEKGVVIFRDQNANEKKTIDENIDDKKSHDDNKNIINYRDERIGEEELKDGRKKIYYHSGFIITDPDGLIVGAEKTDSSEDGSGNIRDIEKKIEQRRIPNIELAEQLKSVKETQDMVLSYIFNDEQKTALEEPKDKKPDPVIVSDEVEKKQKLFILGRQKTFDYSQQDMNNKSGDEIVECLFADANLSTHENVFYITGTGKKSEMFLSVDYLYKICKEHFKITSDIRNEICVTVNEMVRKKYNYDLFASEQGKTFYKINNTIYVKLRKHLTNTKSPIYYLFENIQKDSKYFLVGEPVSIND